MKQYTCTITYPGGVCTPTFVPPLTRDKRCVPGDEITFFSPDVDSELNFSSIGSPFTSGQTIFVVGKAAVKESIATGTNNKIFPFACSPGRIPQPGGGEVPVGS